ncbi:MAG: DUF3857 domain-containing transglutaminase family protein [Deltaproteobacteria bacterium]|nr:DUF3857 domain-containing transglutaminase family protein [Deltaproteobacteria bacterium]
MSFKISGFSILLFSLLFTFILLIIPLGAWAGDGPENLSNPKPRTYQENLPQAEAPLFLRQISRKTYPYAHAVLASEIEHLEYQDDGSMVSQDEVYITILDEEGKRNHEVLSFQVNKAYGRLELEGCEILREGRRRPVDIAAHSREEAAADDSRSNIYNPLQKVVKVFLPGLEIGDTIYYHLNRRQFKPIIAGQIYGSILGQYDIPVRSYIFTVTTPAATALKWLIKDEVKNSVTFRESSLPGERPRTIRSWTFREVPPIVPEPEMPSFRRVAMRLLYSTLPNWPAIAAWYDTLAAKKLSPGAELRKKVAELTAGQDNNEKMAVLFYYVARQIRYLGVSGESERPGFEPHDVNLTFARRHGVCRDKAALLVSMLRLAGFRAAPVLISVGDKLDQEIPLPYFNHAIVAVLDAAGKPLQFLDPTSETSRQFLPDYERECSYLIADAQNGSLALTPPVPPEENSFIIEIDDELSATGALSGTMTISCLGFNDTMMRAIMMNQSRKEQKNFLERLFLSQYPGLELYDLTGSDPADRSRNVTFAGKFSLPPTASSPKPAVNRWQPLAFMENPGLLDRWILKKADMVKRHYPLKLGYTYTTILREHLSFQQPPANLWLPENTAVDNEIFSESLKFTREEPDKLFIERCFALKKTEIEPQSYQRLTALQNRKQQRALTPIAFEGPEK